MQRFTHTKAIISGLVLLVAFVFTTQVEAKRPVKKAAKKAKVEDVKTAYKGHKSKKDVSIWDKDETLVPLEDQVAIRHRYELRKKRIELGVATGITMNRAYMNAFMIGARAQFHFNDYLALGTEWQFGLNYQSPLTNELSDTYKAKNDDADDYADREDFDYKISKLSRLKAVGDVRLSFTPFSGKMGVFSALFMGYDLYVFGGVAFGLTGNDIEDPEHTDKTNEAFNVGLAWGFGIHVFLNNYIALGLEFKDLMFMDNETGEDVTLGRKADEQESCANSGNVDCRLVNGDDRRFLSHFFFGLNLTFFLPKQPDIAF